MICTVSTIKDSVRNVTSFVKRNLAAGADHLFVFVEGGDRQVLDLLGAHEHVTVIDSDTLNRQNPQPDGLNARQTINANRVNCLLADVDSAEWLFHIDGDECLDIDKERLLALGEDVPTVRLAPKESVSTATEDGEVWFKRLLGVDELALLTVLGQIDGPTNGRYFHGHTSGKVGIRPSVRYGLHIHQSRLIGEEDTHEDFTADWLSLLHYESVTLEEFLRKWSVNLAAGPDTSFRGQKELVRGAVSAVLGNEHLDAGEQRQYLTEIYRRRIEDDVPALRRLGLLETAQDRGLTPASFARREETQMARVLPLILQAPMEYFLPRRTRHDPAELMDSIRAETGSRRRRPS